MIPCPAITQARQRWQQCNANPAGTTTAGLALLPLLQPENLLVGAEGYLRLADMGFAKVVAGKTYTM